MESNQAVPFHVVVDTAAAAFGNLVEVLADASNTEQFSTLLQLDGVRIERIISKGQTTPAGQWYDQPWHEWVVVLSGAAQLEVVGEPGVRRLEAGQWCLLPAGCRHRVHWTDPEQETVWLAVHWDVTKTVQEKP